MEFDSLDYREELEVCLEASAKAGNIMDRYSKGRARVKEEKKAATDIVTEADLKSQEAVVDAISEEFPNDGFLGEEEHLEPEGEERIWIIDPVDGTSNFKAGFDYYCVSIALEVGGETKLGVVYSPEEALNQVFLAVKGEGSFKAEGMDLENAEKIKVSERNDLEGSMVFSRLTDFFENEFEQQKELLADMVSNQVNFRFAGAGALELCKVAEGVADGFISNVESRWDFAAGKLILEEAGGTVETEVSDFDDKYIVTASNGRVQEELVSMARKFYE